MSRNSNLSFNLILKFIYFKETHLEQFTIRISSIFNFIYLFTYLESIKFVGLLILIGFIKLNLKSYVTHSVSLKNP